MGFSSWAYDSSPEAIDDTWRKAHAHGDVVKVHFTQGIPWREALAGSEYHDFVEREITRRSRAVNQGMPVFLSVDSLDPSRGRLAEYWGERGNMPMPASWQDRTFSHPDVIAAYTAFALDLIDRFDPVMFSYGAEAGNLVGDMSTYNEFVFFAQGVYTAIKAEHPDLPTIISVPVRHPASEETELYYQQLGDLAPYTDRLGLSVYPFLFGHAEAGNPGKLPPDWLDHTAEFMPEKQLIITETAWAAENVEVPELYISVRAKPQWQEAYVHSVLSAANAHGMDMVIWNYLADYDRLWEGLLNRSPVDRVYRDTGLYDGELSGRPSLAAWETWRKLPRQ
jgi:hypothetical protein